MDKILKAFSYSDVKLLKGTLSRKTELNRKYLMKLETDKLLLNYYIEAGLWGMATDRLDGVHGGWEAPGIQLRGHFLGHWLSASARIYAATGDMEVKAKADHIVSELSRCQKENGGEWAGSIPEKYLHWIAQGRSMWAPQYTLHKTFMGLIEMYQLTDNKQALEIAVNWAKWFTKWTRKFTREEFNRILDIETGGMLEVWADLYGITTNPEHLELLNCYDRPWLFDAIVKGEDLLTNMHANTTIPEILGAAKAYEVTGDNRWRDIVEAYWDLAVTERGTFCTGGQSTGEVWTPMQQISARLGDKNQEHCTVYNMMRLSEFLFRWTGDVKYADYWERGLHNGILAQGHWEGSYVNGIKPLVSDYALITYFLPLQAGSKKGWGTETGEFWCCHGSLLQANSTHNTGIYYKSEDEITVCQYIPSEVSFKAGNNNVRIKQIIDTLAGPIVKINPINYTNPSRPNKIVSEFTVESDSRTSLTMRFRMPWWLKGKATITINDEVQDIETKPSSFVAITRAWSNDIVRIELPKGLITCPLPDQPDVVAFMDGPVVLAGLCDEERIIYGDKDHPETILLPHNEREWLTWKNVYRTYNQERGIKFMPLNEVGYETYTVYFQIKNK